MIFQKNANCYARAKEIFFAALELDAAQHSEFVRLKCGDDTELREEVESLLAARNEARSFLESPVLKTVSQQDNLQNRIIGGYRLIKELGKGGMGVVYLAEKEDAEFCRQVALKIVKSSHHSETFFKRLKLERQILAHLEHPNIVRLIDGGATEAGWPYFVMEYVEGMDLINYSEMNTLPLVERLELFRQVCAAVADAHRHGVIHRDLKPSNILVTKDGTAKLLDFGIAKILSSDSSPRPEAATTLRAMTPEYASPEQIKGETITTLSDVYALGVILYELLTGARPYPINSENLLEIGRAVCEVEPFLPSLVMLDRREAARKSKKSNPQSAIPNPQLLRGDLDNILLKALRKEPHRRYRSVDDLSEDLQRHLKGLPVSARPDTFVYRAEKFIRRNRVAVVFAVLGILALLGGMVATAWQARRAELERARAERRFNDVRALAKSFVFELNDEILKGQTQGRELVVKRALEYLDRLADEAKEDVSLQRELAVAYLKIGDIQGKPYNPNLGDTAGAVESYRKALLILATLYRDNPDNREIQRDLAAAYLSIGSMQGVRTLKLGEALENVQKSLTLNEALMDGEPTNVEHRRMLADNYTALGDALSNLDEKIAMHRKALAIREQLLATDPTNSQELTAIASIYQRIGTILRNKAAATESVADYRETLEYFNKSLAIYEKLQEAEPNNSRHRRNAADIKAMRMPVQANLGDKAGIINSHKTAMKIFEELSAVDPKNAEARLDIAYAHQFMCRSMLKLNNAAAAVKSCREGVKVSESLFAADPTNTEIRSYIIVNYKLIGRALQQTRDSQEMLENFRQLLMVAEKWLFAEPDNVAASRTICTACVQIGSCHAQLASDAKLSAKQKNAHWQAARYWLIRGLDTLRDLQKRNLATQDDIININFIEEKIAGYKLSLKSVK
jgi:eukaryotic-like serine/threonine-protein kinase